MGVVMAVRIAVLICLLIGLSAWTHGRAGQTGQNVVDDNAVLVVDDNTVQVVAS